MNDDDLRARLSALAAPPSSVEARARARYHALVAFRGGTAEPRPEPRHCGVMWALPGVAALAVALAAIVLWPAGELTTEEVRDGAAILAQVEAVFPGQLDAVIEREGEVELALASAPGQRSDRSLAVEFRRGGSIIRVLTYSGRRVCVDLGDRRACFEALINGRDHVVVVGEDFVWTVQNGASAGDWKISARVLEHAS